MTFFKTNYQTISSGYFKKCQSKLNQIKESNVNTNSSSQIAGTRFLVHHQEQSNEQGVDLIDQLCPTLGEKLPHLFRPPFPESAITEWTTVSLSDWETARNTANKMTKPLIGPMRFHQAGNHSETRTWTQIGQACRKNDLLTLGQLTSQLRNDFNGNKLCQFFIAGQWGDLLDE